jgi:hypothetical protein
LAERIQVGLLNVLEERDVQIRGHRVRLPLDIVLVATANPEDYTNRGRIITPLKDRFGAQIRTHFAGVTPGTYPSVSEDVATGPGYRYAAPMSRTNAQSMKPATAAKKLDVYLPATPAEFQENPITRDQLATLQADPPQWLTDLRRNGPHPKNLVAARLGISISGLARGGLTEALTTEQIDALRQENPDWLVAEQENYQNVVAEQQRLKALHAKNA